MDLPSFFSRVEQIWHWLLDNKEWFFSGLGLVFVPVLWRFWRLFIRVGKKLWLTARQTVRGFSRGWQTPSVVSVSPVARRLVCEIQGDFIQFSFYTRELHKNLMATWELVRHGRDHPDQDAGDLATRQLELNRYYEATLSFLNGGITNAAQIVFACLQEHFQNRHATKPRCCLKVVIQRADGKYVYDQARETLTAQSHRYKSEYPIHAHSLFRDIEHTTSRGAIQNNIPRAACQREYENARLDGDKVRAVDWSAWDHGKGQGPDQTWMACWRAENDDAPGGELQIRDETWCYKSVLVAPITLRGNTLRKEFRDKVNAKLNGPFENENVERYIFGFVCIDHVACEYFKEDFWGEDMNIAYMAADMLSLYLIERYFLFDASEEFRQLQQYLHDEAS